MRSIVRKDTIRLMLSNILLFARLKQDTHLGVTIVYEYISSLYLSGDINTKQRDTYYSFFEKIDFSAFSKSRIVSFRGVFK